MTFPHDHHGYTPAETEDAPWLGIEAVGELTGTVHEDGLAKVLATL